MSERLPHEKGFHVSWDQMHRDSRALAWRLDGKGPEDGAWRAIVAITRGGMAPAMIVARELDVRNVDTVSVKSYHHQERADAVILKAPDADLMGDGAGILIIDDLVDSGKTLELVRSKYPKAHFATVYAKPQGRPMVDTFITEVSQDTWIFFPWDMALQYVQPYRGTACACDGSAKRPCRRLYNRKPPRRAAKNHHPVPAGPADKYRHRPRARA